MLDFFANCLVPTTQISLLLISVYAFYSLYSITGL
jgi:hypothetical protein